MGRSMAIRLYIETKLEELTPVKVALQYDVIREGDGNLLASGRTVQPFVERGVLRIVNLKKKYPEIWGKLESLK